MILRVPAPSVITAHHGGGGRLMHELLEEVIWPCFGRREVRDSAVLQRLEGRIALSTDSYVVTPIFFPGGDIGSLSVNGTVNDLAMSGARPRALTASFILEEGFEKELLRRVCCSMKEALKPCGVEIVAGDIKVVEKGKGDGIYLTTAGIGVIEHGLEIAPNQIGEGDLIFISSDIARHGVTVLNERMRLGLTGDLSSDTRPLWPTVEALLAGGIHLHCCRDVTRGGLATALIELAEGSGMNFSFAEEKVPIARGVRSACELLGLDPFHVACEGCFLGFVPPDQGEAALRILRIFNPQAEMIGVVVGKGDLASPGDRALGVVYRKTVSGVRRTLEMPSGIELPRIC